MQLSFGPAMFRRPLSAQCTKAGTDCRSEEATSAPNIHKVVL